MKKKEVAEQEGQLEKKIMEVFDTRKFPLSVTQAKALVWKTIDKAKKDFPLNPMIEVIQSFSELKNHTDEEKRLIISEYLKNCDVEKFIFETIEWFEQMFGKA